MTVTSVPVERIFNCTGLIVNKLRYNLEYNNQNKIAVALMITDQETVRNIM